VFLFLQKNHKQTMEKIYLSVLSLISLISLGLWSQSLEEAKRLSSNEQFEDAEKVFQELISLYVIADELENNGQEEDSIKMRIKLNNITDFFVKNFEKDILINKG
jgi:hypothetical protein